MQPLRITTYNIHKGFSQFNRRMMIHELRDGLRTLNSDLVFLQEVQGAHQQHALRLANWPAAAQHEFLADAVWNHAYGRNAVYDHGHHGNAILSRHPIIETSNQDISDHRFEQRGLLHCEVNVPEWPQSLHCFCIHFGLFAVSRKRQIQALIDRIRQVVPDDAPLIIAGDFNDWHNRANTLLVDTLGLVETFDAVGKKLARSFPSILPMLRLDRIYVRGFTVVDAHVHTGRPWSRISDHAALSADLLRA